jgi:hypothetical protein
MSNRCEGLHWNLNDGIDEPLSAVSGLVIVLFGVFGDAGLKHDQPYLQFFVTRASLILTGIGTCAFHCLSDGAEEALHTNRNLYDGVSMAAFTANLFLLHLSVWLTRHRLFSAVLSVLYLFFWVVTNDSALFTFLDPRMKTSDGLHLLSLALQYPVFISTYVYILARLVWMHGWRESLCKEHYPMWIALGVALAFWLLCEFGCLFLSTALFVGHAVWHVGIGYVAIYLTIIGAQHTYNLERTKASSVWWPKLQEKSGGEMRAMLIPKEFGLDTRRMS